MPRKPWKVRPTKHPLLQSEKYLLLTGECVPPKGDWRDIGEKWTRPFTLSSPAGRDELRKLWETHRAELLEEWQREGRRGKPWAATLFDT